MIAGANAYLVIGAFAAMAIAGYLILSASKR